MILTDAHTHIFRKDIPLIWNIDFNTMPPAGVSFSIGIHPMNPQPVDLKQFKKYLSLPDCKAVGECGLDRRSEMSLTRQTDLFLQQTNLAEEFHKPLIIHAVRCHQEIIRLRKDITPSVPWIIHGFRGTERKAMELIDAGFILSFGEGLLRDLSSVEPWFGKLPADRLLLETDESEQPVLPQIFAVAAAMRLSDVQTFSEVINLNFQRMFFND